ncbi:MAG: biotin/lipoyl-binding protein, partial [bacterium]|nr:biotin/lipoyl-binding protein [bacterium]
MNYKVIKLVLLLALSCVIVVSSVACRSVATENQMETANEKRIETPDVKQSDMVPRVTADGRLSFVEHRRLTFGTGGKVAQVNVSELDKVTKGQVLAKLETDALEYALTQAQVARTKAQVSVTQAEIAVTQAEINLERAKIARFQATVFQWPEVEAAQANVDKAKFSVKYAHGRLADATTDDDKERWSRLVAKAEEDLIRAEDRLNVILSGTPIDELVIKKLDVEVAQQSLKLAGESLELARQSLELAEQLPKLAQKQLREATITAPFDGVIAKVNV